MLFVAVVALMLVSPVVGQTVYMDPASATLPGQCGGTWAQACATLADAMAAIENSLAGYTLAIKGNAVVPCHLPGNHNVTIRARSVTISSDGAGSASLDLSQVPMNVPIFVVDRSLTADAGPTFVGLKFQVSARPSLHLRELLTRCSGRCARRVGTRCAIICQHQRRHLQQLCGHGHQVCCWSLRLRVRALLTSASFLQLRRPSCPQPL